MFKSSGKEVASGRLNELSRPRDVMDATDARHLTGGVTPVRQTEKCLRLWAALEAIVRSFFGAVRRFANDPHWVLACTRDMLRRHPTTPAMFCVCPQRYSHPSARST